jgi:hypothetical protein
MLKILLDDPVGSDAKEVAQDLDRIVQQGTRIYSIYFRDETKQYTFMTTSKDVLLGLGTMSKKGLRHLGIVLEVTVVPSNGNMVLLDIGHKTNVVVLVTITKRPEALGEEMIFHLSQAHPTGGH